MVQPVNYLRELGFGDPQQKYQQGAQLGQQIGRGLLGMEDRQLRQQEAQRQEQLRQKEQAFNTELSTTLESGGDLNELLTKHPQKFEQIKQYQDYQTQLKQTGAQDMAGKVYLALERNDPNTVRSLLNTPEAQSMISGMGEQELTPEVVNQMITEDPEGLKDLALGTYRFSGGDLSRLGIKDPAKIGKTAAVSDYEYFQKLKKEDPEAAKQFGRKAGFISREGQELSGHLQKRLSTASDLAVESENNAGRFETLASDFEKAKISGGLFGGKWAEAYKDLAGSQDAVTDLRKRYNAVRSSLVVKNLPPGAASDTDIALALAGFPSENATGEQISTFMRGMAKIEQETARFNNYKSEYISDNGTERGMLREWKQLRKEEETAQKQADIDRKAEEVAQAEQAAAEAATTAKEFEGVSNEDLLNIAFQNQGQGQPAAPQLTPQQQAYQAAYGRR